MSNEQATQFVEQATQSLQGGQFAQALELADQAIALQPNHSDAHVVRGVCLSQMSRPQEATEAFRQALAANAYNAKAYYNFAVHLYAQGERKQALDMAREAVSVDPRHAAAKELADRIQAESAPPAPTGAPIDLPAQPQIMREPTSMPPAETAPPTMYTAQPFVRPGYEQTNAHTIPWVEKLGGTWTGIGWALAALSLASFLGFVVFMFPMIQEIMANPEAYGPGGKQPPSNVLLSILMWGSYLGGLGYTIIDLVDRKGNFLWILPQILCGCCGLGFITLPVYLVANRK